MVVTFFLNDLTKNLEKRLSPSPPSMPNLEVTAADNATGNKTTRGKMDEQWRAHVAEDLPMWHSIWRSGRRTVGGVRSVGRSGPLSK
jgi:hypothetical protein